MFELTMKIAIIGAGMMGTTLAEQFLKSGHEVLVYNEVISKTKMYMAMGADPMMSPTEAIFKSDASIIIMQNSEELKSILLENTDRRAFEGKLLLNGTITDPEESTEIAVVINENGGKFSAMSITNNPGQIENKLTDFIIGPDPESQKFWTDLFIQVLPDPSQYEVGDAMK